MRLFDAHNHLQFPEIAHEMDSVIEGLSSAGIAGAVVNGTVVDDWSAVSGLAKKFDWVRPAYGLHPWFIADRPHGWEEKLGESLTNDPMSSVGEIGLDRWIENPIMPDQLDVLRTQLDLAASLNRPATIHCLRAWDDLRRVLETSRIPQVGILIHAFAGPAQFGKEMLRAGAYFSFPGSFLADRKVPARAFFEQLPADRLLIETDAPSLALPGELVRWRLKEPNANHPANLLVVYQELARIRRVETEELASQIESNFERLFGSYEADPASDISKE